MANSTSTDNKVVYWIVGALFTLAMAFGGLFVNSMDARIVKNSESIEATSIDTAVTQTQMENILNQIVELRIEVRTLREEMKREK